MATQFPPPKRQKLNNGLPIKPPPISALTAKPIPQIVIQFKNASDNTPLGPAINLPADTSRDALQMLVNKLRGQEEDPLPFAFHIAPRNGTGTEGGVLPAQVLPPAQTSEPSLLPPQPIIPIQSSRLQINSSILTDVLEAKLQGTTLSANSYGYTPEDVFEIICEPQSVFRVRSVGRCSSTLSGHGQPILCCALSPTGDFAVTGSGDATARLWNMSQELPKVTLTGHKGWVLCAEFEPRERFIATGGHDSALRFWDISGKPIGEARKGHTKWITSLAWEPIHLNVKGKARCASSSKDGTVKIWNTTQNHAEVTLAGHKASVNVVKWGGEGEGMIYTGSSDRTIKIWSGKDGKLIRTLSEHAHWVNTLALSTDFIIRTGPFDYKNEKVKGDDEAQAMALSRFKAHTSLHPESLISGSDDHTLFLWAPQHSNSSTEGDSGKNSLKKPLARLIGHQKQVNHVLFSPDGRWIASAGFDNAVKLWDGKTGKFIASLRGHVAAVYRLAWSADSRMLVSASKDTTLKLWDLKTYKIRIDLPGHTDEVYCVDFVADKIVSGGRDKTVKIWKN